jgi:hypothetical protein
MNCIFLKNLDRIQSQLDKETNDKTLLWGIVCILGLYVEHELDKCDCEKHKVGVPDCPMDESEESEK